MPNPTSTVADPTTAPASRPPISNRGGRAARAAALCWLLAAAASLEGGQRAVFQTDALHLSIGPDGAVHSVFDRINAVERGVSARPFCYVVLDGKRVAATSMEIDGQRLWFRFGTSGVRAALRIESHRGYLLVVVEAVEGNPSALEFVHLRTRRASDLFAKRILRFDRWCLGLLAGVPEVRSHGSNSKQGRLTATAYTDLPMASGDSGIAGRTAALFASRPRELAQVLEGVERALGIPGGVRSKAHPANRRSYLFVSSGLSHENGDRVIRYARDGGFGAILLGHGSWAHYGRKYAVPKERFPGGLVQLKELVDKIHAAGMLAGAHLYATKVPKQSAYMTPKPDRRLYKDRTIILARALDASSNRVETRTPPTGWPRAPGTRDVQIGDEVFTYTELSLSKSYGFVGCQRGRYGTKAMPHRAGAQMGHLVTDESRAIFVIDQRTDLLDEVAGHIARTYDAAGFDWLFFDGAEDVPEPPWYTVAKGQLTLLDRLQRKPVIVQTAADAPFTWHTTTRKGYKDYFWVSPDAKAEIDDALARRVPWARQALMPAEIGWFPFHVPAGARWLPTIDEIEYLYTKALAVNAAVSILASVAELDALHHRDPILAIMKRLEELRLEDYFADDVKARVREPHADFMLVQDSVGAYHLVRAREIPYVAKSGREVRAFLADPVEDVQTISLWNVGPEVSLELKTPVDSVEITDYLRKPVNAEVLPGARIRIPVTTRLYMKLHGMWRPKLTFRIARVTPMKRDER